MIPFKFAFRHEKELDGILIAAVKGREPHEISENVFLGRDMCIKLLSSLAYSLEAAEPDAFRDAPETDRLALEQLEARVLVSEQVIASEAGTQALRMATQIIFRSSGELLLAGFFNDEDHIVTFQLAREHAHAFLRIIHEIAHGGGWKVRVPSWLTAADLAAKLASQAIQGARRTA